MYSKQEYNYKLKIKKFNRNNSDISSSYNNYIINYITEFPYQLYRGEQGIINRTVSAKNKSKIADEKEKIKTSVLYAMGKNKTGVLEKDKLQKYLNINLGENYATIEQNGENYWIITNDSKRYYEVNYSGQVEYLGTESEALKNLPNLIIGDSIYKNENATQNTYINLGDGELKSYNGWDTSDYIDVGKYKKIMIMGETDKFLSQYNAVYDSNKNFIKTIAFSKSILSNELIGDVNFSITIFDVESGIEYLRISEDREILNSIKIYSINDDFNGIFSFKIVDEAEEKYSFGNNRISSNNIVEKSYISESDGRQIAYGTWDSTNYIYIGDCKRIAISGEKLSSLTIYNALYDEEKKFISNINMGTLKTNSSIEIGNYKILEVPEDVSYIRLSSNSGNFASIKIYSVEDKEEILYQHKKENLQIGDSIFTENIIQKNKYISTSGQEIKYNGWDATDFIDIGSYEGVIVKQHSGEYNALYDKNKNFYQNIVFSSLYVKNQTIGKIGINLKYIAKSDKYKYIRLSQAASELQNVNIYPVLNSDFDKYLNFKIK